ncbi:MAG TPA: CPBP family intramembrane glutamic endopeptidase [Cyclobacteriaceae bacterium]|nr:CPBP family intramembrane glutamic endopeptidase [Cyclobacteriaceae bacterium]
MKHSIAKSIILHLYPGVLTLSIYLLLTPWINSIGYPSMMSLLISAVIGLIIPESLLLLHRSYRRNGRLVFKGIFIISERINPARLAILVLTGFAIIAIAGTAIYFLEQPIKISLFSWLPEWYFFDGNFNRFSQKALLVTAIARVVVDGLLLPVVEELYFRGYLLPRMPETSFSQPLLASVLFTIYHFWQPWNYVSLFAASLVLVFSVWKFKNLYLSIAIHVLANLVGSLLFLGFIGSIRTN